MEALKNFFNSGSIARLLAFAGWSRQRAFRKSSARFVALVLAFTMFANSLGQHGRAQQSVETSTDVKATTLGILAVTGVLTGAGVGVYVLIQHRHTAKGCVSDSPDGLRLRTDDGKTFVLLGATTRINADEKIKVTGIKKKRVDGITDQPSFVVEKLNKVYGSCTVTSAVP